MKKRDIGLQMLENLVFHSTRSKETFICLNKQDGN